MKVALFTHHFLEPTHHAIAQVLEELRECEFTVYAKRFADHFALPNVRSRIAYAKGPVPGLNRDAFDLAHAIYDGKIAMRAQLAAAGAGIPFVLSFHGGFDTHAKIHDPRYRERSRLVAEAAAAVTVPCRRDVEQLRMIGVRRVVTVLPVPVVLSAARRSRRADPQVLVLVGRLVPKKGVDIALRAMQLMPGYRLDVVGDGELRPELQALAEGLGVAERVRFLGLQPIAVMERLVGNAFALLHPARVAADGNAEGTPQVVLMAQAMGVPVVAALSGSLGEVIADERSGLLVPPDDPMALAAAVHRLAAEPALRARLERPAPIGERSVDAVANRLRKIYASACASRPDHAAA